MITLQDKRAVPPLPAQVKFLDLDLNEICNLACEYCRPAGSPVLMVDGTYRRVETIRPGDVVMGFQKQRSETGKSWVTKLTPSTVVGVGSREAPLVRVMFDNHPSLLCTPDHRWFTGRSYTVAYPGQMVRRISQEAFVHEETPDFCLGYLQGLIAGDGTVVDKQYTYRGKKVRQRRIRIALKDTEPLDRVIKYTQVLGLPKWVPVDVSDWFPGGQALRSGKKELREACTTLPMDPSQDFMRGWVAGMYDAEGSLDIGVLKVSQNEGPTHRRLVQYLTALGFSPRDKHYAGASSRTIEIGTQEQIIRFLTMCPPAIPRRRDLVGVMLRMRKALVTKVVPAGEGMVYSLQTETGNYFSSGLASKNCYFGKKLGFTMLPEVAQRALDTLFLSSPEPGVRQVHGFGGETLLSFELMKMIVLHGEELSAQTGHPFRWGLTSNITLLNQEMVEFFVAHHGSIHCSIDGSPRAHDRVRVNHAGKGSSQEVAENVPLALTITPLDSARMTIPPKNAQYLLESVEYIRSLGFQSAACIPAFEGDWTNYWSVLDDQLGKVTRWWLKLIKKGEVFRLKFIDDGLKAIISPVKRAQPCAAGKSLLAVGVDGQVSPCHRFSGTMKTAFKVGKLGEELNLDVLKPFQEFDARSHSWPECRRCEAYYACAGGCPAVNFGYHGRIDRKHPSYCTYTQMTYRHARFAFEELRARSPKYLLDYYGTTREGVPEPKPWEV